jgi:hypothetical protein
MQLRVTQGKDLVAGESWVAMTNMGMTEGLCQIVPLLEVNEHLSSSTHTCYFSEHMRHVFIAHESYYLEVIRA